MPNAIVDLHSHPLTHSFIEALALEECQPSGKPSVDGVELPSWSVDQHLAAMDQNGIGICMLSVNSVSDAMAGPEGHPLARLINEELAAIVAQHPSRFGAFAAIPMDDMKAALAETAYALDVLKLDGLSAPTQYCRSYLGEPAYDPWLAELDRRGATLFVHPVRPPFFDVKTSRINVSVVEFMFETTRMLTTMVLSGAKTRFPNINIVATHAGGAIPFLAHRISLAAQMPWAFRGGVKLNPQEVQAAFGSFYYDLTASTAATSLDAIRALVPPSRLLMGV